MYEYILLLQVDVCLGPRIAYVVLISMSFLVSTLSIGSTQTVVSASASQSAALSSPTPSSFISLARRMVRRRGASHDRLPAMAGLGPVKVTPLLPACHGATRLTQPPSTGDHRVFWTLARLQYVYSAQTAPINIPSPVSRRDFAVPCAAACLDSLFLPTYFCRPRNQGTVKPQPCASLHASLRIP